MSRTIEEIEADMNNVTLSMMCCRDETQVDLLIQRGEELRNELDQAKKEARDE